MYPKEWGDFIHEPKKDRCLNISGKYLNIGKPARTNPNTDKISAKRRSELSTLLYPSLYEVDITHVEFMWIDTNTLEIAFWQDQQVLFKKQLSKSEEDFLCGPVSIIFEHAGLENLPEGGGVVVKRTSLFLAKTSDGSLVVNFHSFRQGLALLVIPYSTSNSFWHRHTKID